MRTIGVVLLALCGACASESPAHDCAGACSDPNEAALDYSIAHVTGTFGGGDVHTMNAGAFDSLDDTTCMFDSAGTTSDQMLAVFQPEPNASPAIGGVHGKVACPIVTGASVPGALCRTSDAVELADMPFSWTISADAWDDSSTVRVTALGPPSGLPYCNTAAVVTDPAHAWGMSGTATVGAFRGDQPFDVQLTGTTEVTSDSHVSDVHWDLTITFQPRL